MRRGVGGEPAWWQIVRRGPNHNIWGISLQIACILPAMINIW
jgi:hypothetical protein